MVEDSQVSSLMRGLQGVVLFQEGFFGIFGECPYFSVLGALLEYARMCTRSPFGVCTYMYWSPFGVCTYLYVCAAPLKYVITYLRSHMAQTKS